MSPSCVSVSAVQPCRHRVLQVVHLAVIVHRKGSTVQKGPARYRTEMLWLDAGMCGKINSGLFAIAIMFLGSIFWWGQCPCSVDWCRDGAGVYHQQSQLRVVVVGVTRYAAGQIG